jgi:hypothetical protein
MANQIQWLEPLLTCAFFSPTQNAVGKTGEDKDTEGSFRVMNIGWGNFAGSNVRRIGSTGLDRGANIFPYWRKGFHFKSTKKLDDCAASTPPYYKKARTIHTGDFRTFGFEYDMEKCKKEYRPEDCPKADGAPMKLPYGLEIRIFDHFPSEHLIDLMRIIILVAANAKRNPAKEYVYRDKRWIAALREIMRDGWNANLSKSYISALRANFGVPIDTCSTLAMDVLRTIVHELFMVNKDSFINHIMNEHPEIEPKLPEINRECWELSFMKNYNIKILNILKRHFYVGEEMTMNQFIKRLREIPEFEMSRWENDMNDVLYALEKNNHVQLEVINGKIKNVKVM